MEKTMQEEIMSIMNTQVEKLEDMLEVAIHDFAKVALKECEPRVIFDKKTKCQIIEAQLMMLKDLMNNVVLIKREVKIPQFKNV